MRELGGDANCVTYTRTQPFIVKDLNPPIQHSQCQHDIVILVLLICRMFDSMIHSSDEDDLSVTESMRKFSGRRPRTLY